MTVAIVTDSTSDLPRTVASELGITIMPLSVNFGERSYKDGRDITSEQFFEMLVAEKEFPRTTQPSVGDFKQCYTDLAKDHDTIVSMHISAKLSGTYNSATAAAAEFKDGTARIEVIDMLSVSMALGLAVMDVARKAKDGAGAEDVIRAAHEAVGRVDFFCTAETVKYLQKGGRIGKLSYLMGSLLSIRPIATLDNGATGLLARSRSMKKARQRMVEELRNNMPLQQACIVHANNPEVAKEFEAQIEAALPEVAPVMLSSLGPITGAHIGPGALGVALIRK